MLGYSFEELMVCNFAALTHPDDIAPFTDWLQAVKTGGQRQSLRLEKRYFHKEGHIVWAILTVSVTCAPHGKPLHLIGQIQDITEMKQAAMEQAKLIAILEATPDFVGTALPDGTTLCFAGNQQKSPSHETCHTPACVWDCGILRGNTY